MDDIKKQLLEAYPRGSTVFTVVRHVSQSGMYRHISIVKPEENYCLNYSKSVADLLGSGFKWVNKNHSAIGVSGCGMDMGFHIVYQLSHFLYNDGYALKQKWI